MGCSRVPTVSAHNCERDGRQYGMMIRASCPRVPTTVCQVRPVTSLMLRRTEDN